MVLAIPNTKNKVKHQNFINNEKNDKLRYHWGIEATNYFSLFYRIAIWSKINSKPNLKFSLQDI